MTRRNNLLARKIFERDGDRHRGSQFICGGSTETVSCLPVVPGCVQTPHFTSSILVAIHFGVSNELLRFFLLPLLLLSLVRRWILVLVLRFDICVSYLSLADLCQIVNSHVRCVDAQRRKAAFAQMSLPEHPLAVQGNKVNAEWRRIVS